MKTRVNYRSILIKVLRDNADYSEARLWTEGFCGAVGGASFIDTAFGRWHWGLREVAKYDKDFPKGKWWVEVLGKYGKKPLTRALLAQRKRPRVDSWSLNL